MQIVLYIPRYTDEQSTFPRPLIENYDYWIALVEYFLIKSDTIELQCWNEEMETIEEINSLFNDDFEIVKEKQISIFKGKKTLDLTNFLLENHLNKMGVLKWFTVNLSKGKRELFHSGHWGTELFVARASKRDIAFIEGITPTGTSFHQFL